MPDYIYKYQYDPSAPSAMDEYTERMGQLREMLGETYASNQEQAELIAAEEAKRQREVREAVEAQEFEQATDIAGQSLAGGAKGAAMGGAFGPVGALGGGIIGSAVGGLSAAPGAYEAHKKKRKDKGFSWGALGNVVKDQLNPINALKGTKNFLGGQVQGMQPGQAEQLGGQIAGGIAAGQGKSSRVTPARSDALGELARRYKTVSGDLEGPSYQAPQFEGTQGLQLEDEFAAPMRDEFSPPESEEFDWQLRRPKFGGG